MSGNILISDDEIKKANDKALQLWLSQEQAYRGKYLEQAASNVDRIQSELRRRGVSTKVGINYGKYQRGRRRGRRR